MPKRPRISVIMPCYNHQAFVRPAIQSVLSQSFSDLELIIIDDCSDDESFHICESEKNDRTSLFRNEKNEGAHATLNKLLSLAQGDFIAIINSDDIFHNRRIEKILKHMETNDIDLCGTTVTLINETGAPISDVGHWWNKWYLGMLEKYREEQSIKNAILRGNLYITTSNMVFRRCVVEAVSGFTDERYLHDYSFLLRSIFSAKISASILDEPLLSYRLHNANTITENPLKANEEAFSVLSHTMKNVPLPSALNETALNHIEVILYNIKNLYLTSTQLCRIAESEVKEKESRISAQSIKITELRDKICEMDLSAQMQSQQIEALKDELLHIKQSTAFRTGVKLAQGWQNIRNGIERITPKNSK